MKKRLLSMTLFLCMCMTLIPITAFASEELTFDLPDEEVILEGIGGVKEHTSQIQTWSIQPNSIATELYYDQLDERSKQIYNLLKTAYQNGPTADKISLSEVTFDSHTATITNSIMAESDKAIFRQELRDALIPAFGALIYDCPEMSWIVNVQFGYSYHYAIHNSSVVDLGNDSYSALVTPINVTFHVTSAETNTGAIQDIDSAIAQAKNALSQEPYSLSEDMTREETAKVIHDYICDTVAYESDDVFLRQYQTGYSAFYDCDNDGKIETVCAGYSRAFKLLCEQYDIPCVLVSGEAGNSSDSMVAHMWNYVRMEDGQWYAVDCTWDDQSSIFYDYFLSGSTTVDTHFNRQTFAQTHVAGGEIVTGYTFSFPILSDEMYTASVHTHAWDTGEVTIAATCTAEGEKTYTCTLCGETTTEAIAKVEHTVVIDVAVPATCTHTGLTEGVHCSVCGEIFAEQTEIPKLDHNWDNGEVTTVATCTAEGEKTYTCTLCGETTTEAIAKTEHTVVIDVAVLATCTHTGLTLGAHCSVCGEIFAEQTEIPKLDHNWDNGEVTIAATCIAEGEKTYTCTLCGETITEIIPKLTPDVSFTDVPPNEYYADAVKWAVSQGITNGTNATAFEPDSTCTRGQIVTFLWRAMGSPESVNKHNPFIDVPASAYYNTAVLWAVENGITSGTSATTFSPKDSCTRAQAVTFLWRTGGQPEVDRANPFVDVDIHSYYQKAVLWAVSQDITNGTSATTFEPNTSCTRGQIVTFLYRDMA